MSYQVLARKYRPTRFDEMEGQEHVLRALINALEQNRLHHAYLFTGTRGVGKTTIARILAKCLNCEAGVTATPCGECSSCQEIAQGRAVDLIEIDAASRTGVDDMRDLISNAQYMPTRARFKVYLIDEVHMLSNSSFNALLKTLEEPPEHVKFLFATTDPKKLPITVLSRCLQFNLKNLSPERIVNYLKLILPKEGIEFDEPALWQLGRAADGSMRDALSLTDQAISFGENRLSDDDVRAMLGAIDQREVYGLLDALIQKDAPALLGKIAAMAEFGPDWEMLLGEMLSVLHRVAVAQAVPGGVDNSQGDRELVEAVAKSLPKEDVQLYYQIALIGSRDLPLAPDPREGFEMVLLRMLSFAPEETMAEGGDRSETGGGNSGDAASSPIQDILSRIGKDESRSAAGKARAESGSPRDEPPVVPDHVTNAVTDEPRAERPVADSSGGEASAGTASPKSSPEHGEPTPLATGSGAEAEQASATAAENEPALVDTGEHAPETEDASPRADAAPATSTVPQRISLKPADWVRVCPRLELGGVTRTLAFNCELTRIDGAAVVLTLREHHASMLNDVHIKRIREALSSYVETPVSLTVDIGEVTAETPQEAHDREVEEARVRAVAAIENDENVRRLIETFDGKLNIDSIVPLDNQRHAGE